ncbi:MAG: hypothetical protein JWR83_892, partial [Aeromicrobium sp.]|nr:hypothetical protein [Aeromicrobium sp.]
MENMTAADYRSLQDAEQALVDHGWRPGTMNSRVGGWGDLVDVIEDGYTKTIDDYTNDLDTRRWLDLLGPLLTKYRTCWSGYARSQFVRVCGSSLGSDGGPAWGENAGCEIVQGSSFFGVQVCQELLFTAGCRGRCRPKQVLSAIGEGENVSTPIRAPSGARQKATIFQLVNDVSHR